MSVQDEIGNLIAFYPVLSELPSDLQHSLIDASFSVTAPANDILFDVNTVIKSFLLLTQGSIRAIRSGKERDVLLYRVRPGSCCAISICHMMGDTRCRARAETESMIKGIALPMPLFREMMDRSVPFNRFIFHTLAGHFSDLIDQLDAIISLRLDERLARILLLRGPVVQTTHAQLANELGSVREVIGRILNDFASKNLIHIERGQINVLNAEDLSRIAQIYDPNS